MKGVKPETTAAEKVIADIGQEWEAQAEDSLPKEQRKSAGF